MSPAGESIWQFLVDHANSLGDLSNQVVYEDWQRENQAMLYRAAFYIEELEARLAKIRQALGSCA